MDLHATAKECGFSINQPEFASMFFSEPATSAETMARINRTALKYYNHLVESTSFDECSEWRHVADSRDAVLPDARHMIPPIRRRGIKDI